MRRKARDALAASLAPPEEAKVAPTRTERRASTSFRMEAEQAKIKALKKQAKSKVRTARTGEEEKARLNMSPRALAFRPSLRSSGPLAFVASAPAPARLPTARRVLPAGLAAALRRLRRGRRRQAEQLRRRAGRRQSV